MDPQTIRRVVDEGRDIATLPAAFAVHQARFPYAEHVGKVLDYLSGPDQPLPELPLGPFDAPIYANLPMLKQMVDWTDCRLRPQRPRRTLVSPRDDEKLLHVGPADWTNLMLLNHVLLSWVRPRRRAAVVVTMRDDGVSLLEWVAHYQAVGFDSIYIYSNDNLDGSPALFELLSASGAITFIDNQVTGTHSPQRKAFEHAVHLLPELRDHEYVFFADSDEFLVLPAAFDHRIGAVLDAVASRYPDRLPAAVCYQWKWFVSGDTFKRADTPLLRTFKHSRPHGLIKSVVRIRDVLSMRVLHFPEVAPPAFFVDSNLEVIPQSVEASPKAMWEYRTPCYGGGQINHYWNKSFEEFAVKKRRGDAITATENPYSRDFKQFFDWNGAETEANRDPPPASLLARVDAAYHALRAIPGVAEADRRIRDGFPNLLAPFGWSRGLRDIYEGYYR